MFLDEATIDVSGGNGGRGAVSWRREKYVPRGGPDGGDGGRGGDVIIRADANTDTLSDFASRKRFEAENGQFGSGSNKHGRDGDDLVLLAPPGTLITEIQSDGTTETFADLIEPGDQVRVARGGRGGFGNAHFKSSTRQRPDFAELGEPGEKRAIKLELKLVADVGIIGYPSVGKSTLISVISAAKPKIADYPFTTLIPNLGVVDVGDRSFVVADVPGLIEGASEGKGLGDAFLKHIERCGVLLHMLDASRAFVVTDGTSTLDPALLVADYRAIRKELEAYSPTLASKRELVVLNKIDVIPDRIDDMHAALHAEGIELFATISAATSQGTEDLKRALLPIVLEERDRRARESGLARDAADKAIPVLRPHLEREGMGAYRIERAGDKLVRIHGRRLEQFTIMTDFSNTGAVLRFHDVLDRIGLLKEIKRLHLPEDAVVMIGETRVDKHL